MPLNKHCCSRKKQPRVYWDKIKETIISVNAQMIEWRLPYLDRITKSLDTMSLYCESVDERESDSKYFWYYLDLKIK